MFEKILIPLDGSKTAEMVIPYAEELTAKLGSQMILASVSEFLQKGAGKTYHSYVRRTTEQVQHQLNTWNPSTVTQVQSEVLVGKPADEILRYAYDMNIGLIAMTSRGSSTPGPWPLGSTAAKIIRATTKPILLVKAPANDDAVRQKKLIKRILVPLDGSNWGASAIPHATALSQALRAELVLLHSIEPELEIFPPYEARLPPITDQARMITKAKVIEYLEDIARPMKQKGLNVSTAVDFKYAANSIIDYAKTNSIDLVAMSTHGEKGIGRWVLGSVTDKVLHTGDTAVLVVRRAET